MRIVGIVLGVLAVVAFLCARFRDAGYLEGYTAGLAEGKYNETVWWLHNGYEIQAEYKAGWLRDRGQEKLKWD